MTCTRCGTPIAQPGGHCTTCATPAPAVPEWSQSEGNAPSGLVAPPAYAPAPAAPQSAAPQFTQDDAPSGLPLFGAAPAAPVPADPTNDAYASVGAAPQYAAPAPAAEQYGIAPAAPQYAPAPAAPQYGTASAAPQYGTAPTAPQYGTAPVAAPYAPGPVASQYGTTLTTADTPVTGQHAPYGAPAPAYAPQPYPTPPSPYGQMPPMPYQTAFQAPPTQAGSILSTVAIVLAVFALVVGIFVNPLIPAAASIVCASIGMRRGERLAKLGLVLGIIAGVYSLGLLALNLLLLLL